MWPIYLALSLFLLHTLYTFLYTILSPLRSIPGPLLARFSKLPYLLSIYRGTHERDAIALHRKYAPPGSHFAPIVRLAPNMYSLKTPEKLVYGVGSKMPKSEWYEGWKHPSPERWTLFTDRNIKRHAESRRVYAGLYAMSALLSYEAYVDDCADIFLRRLGEMSSLSQQHGRRVVDMGHWLQCYAFDVIGAITYGKRFGFLDEGKDLGGTIGALDRNMAYSTLVGVYAWLHPYLYAILERFFPKSGAAGRAYLMRFAGEALAQRRAERARGKKERADGEPEDFVDKMLDMQEEKPGVGDYHVFALTMSNIVAGSDTTALSLSSVLYHLVRTPRALRKLREEIARGVEEVMFTSERVGFKASQEMPYLQACIKEGLRLHPGTGLPLWRTVNEGGATISGQYFPARAEVGINTWVVHYDADIWGADVEDFRPERWIEADPERLKVMEAHYVPVSVFFIFCGSSNL